MKIHFSHLQEGLNSTLSSAIDNNNWMDSSSLTTSYSIKG